MARPGELIWCVAEAFGLPEPTVTQYDRLLHEAGLRTKGGRGRSAAKAKPRDAAHLVTAALASAQVKDAVQSVERYSLSRINKHTSSAAGYSRLGVAALNALAAHHSYIDALEALIASAADGTLGRVMEAAAQVDGFFPVVRIAAQTPHTVGDIQITASAADITIKQRYALPNPFDTHNSVHPPQDEVEAWEEQVRRYHSEADLTQYREVSGTTLRKLGRLLSS